MCQSKKQGGCATGQSSRVQQKPCLTAYFQLPLLSTDILVKYLPVMFVLTRHLNSGGNNSCCFLLWKALQVESPPF